MNFRRIFKSCFWLVIMLVAPQANAQWSKPQPDTLRLDGYIGESSLSDFESLFDSNVKNVVLNSPGGFEMPAAKIADRLSASRVKIIVDGLCVSACANYLFVAKKRPAVRCGSVISWHGSKAHEPPSPEELRAQGQPEDFIAKQVNWSNRLRAISAQLYSSSGVHERILYDSAQAVSGLNIKTHRTYSFNVETGSSSVSETSSDRLWIPTAAMLRGYGFDTRDFCSSYDFDIEKALESRGIKAVYTRAPVNI